MRVPQNRMFETLGINNDINKTWWLIEKSIVINAQNVLGKLTRYSLCTCPPAYCLNARKISTLENKYKRGTVCLLYTSRCV